jgi:bacterioferritin-associated ferredoxin
MYVCNCHGITERQVKDALDRGINKWSDVHAHYDCQPCCGKCQCDIVNSMQKREKKALKNQEPFFASQSPVNAT